VVGKLREVEIWEQHRWSLSLVVGDPNAIFIFQAGFQPHNGYQQQVVLENGAQACNIFWSAYSSATLGTYSNFIGTIITSQEAITDDGYSTINGTCWQILRRLH